MSLKELTKEQKQYVVLGLLSVAILVILMALGIRLSMATISTAREELDDLTAKIERANKALSRSKKTSADYVETIGVLQKYLANAPPERNYYSWATEVIYSKARLADLEIDSIDEITLSDQRSSAPDGDGPVISFESYALRIMGHGGYESTKYFISLLKQDYPLVRFSGVEISSGQNPEAHDVQLFMQWPFNFGEITRNWDAIANTQMKIEAVDDEPEAASLKDPESAQKSETPATSAAKSDSVRQPHPPTTRPEARKASVHKPIFEHTVLKTEPGINAVSEGISVNDSAPVSSTGLQSAFMPETSHVYVAISKSEKMLKECLSMRSN
jgi:hypothetical protein